MCGSCVVTVTLTDVACVGTFGFVDSVLFFLRNQLLLRCLRLHLQKHPAFRCRHQHCKQSATIPDAKTEKPRWLASRSIWPHKVPLLWVLRSHQPPQLEAVSICRGLDVLYLYFSFLSVAYVSEFVVSDSDFVTCLQLCDKFIIDLHRKKTFKWHKVLIQYILIFDTVSLLVSF